MSAAFLLFRYARRRPHEITEPKFNEFAPPPNARPLFAPTESELRREANAQEARVIEQREYHARAESSTKVDAALSNWRDLRSVNAAAELLLVTAEHGLDGDFSRSANEIVGEFRTNGIDDISKNDLAALLDSHLRLLSAGAQSSGELFWLRQEIVQLNEANVSE